MSQAEVGRVAVLAVVVVVVLVVGSMIMCPVSSFAFRPIAQVLLLKSVKKQIFFGIAVAAVAFYQFRWVLISSWFPNQNIANISSAKMVGAVTWLCTWSKSFSAH